MPSHTTLVPMTCPFCGTRPKLLPVDPRTEGDAWAMVRCQSRQCAVNPEARVYADHKPFDKVVRQWNRRARDRLLG